MGQQQEYRIVSRMLKTDGNGSFAMLVRDCCDVSISSKAAPWIVTKLSTSRYATVCYTILALKSLSDEF